MHLEIAYDILRHITPGRCEELLRDLDDQLLASQPADPPSDHSPASVSISKDDLGAPAACFDVPTFDMLEEPLPHAIEDEFRADWLSLSDVVGPAAAPTSFLDSLDDDAEPLREDLPGPGGGDKTEASSNIMAVHPALQPQLDQVLVQVAFIERLIAENADERVKLQLQMGRTASPPATLQKQLRDRLEDAVNHLDGQPLGDRHRLDEALQPQQALTDFGSLMDLLPSASSVDTPSVLAVVNRHGMAVHRRRRRR